MPATIRWSDTGFEAVADLAKHGPAGHNIFDPLTSYLDHPSTKYLAWQCSIHIESDTR